MSNFKGWKKSQGTESTFLAVLFLIGAFIFITCTIGYFYWIWTAFQIGSFLMFLFAFIPLLNFIAATVGGWSLLFDVPVWVTVWFG